MMDSKFDAVLFDMDGLMLDSERVYYRAQKDAGRQLGYEPSHEMMVSFVGQSAENCETTIVEAAQHIFTIDEFHTLWTRLWREYIQRDGIPLKEGLLPLLQWLQTHNVPRSVVTSSLSSEADLALGTTGIDKYFDVIITSDNIEHLKPAPDIYLLAAEKVGVRPEACIALEDSDAGVFAATSAGMRTIMIPDLREPSPAAIERAYMLAGSLTDVFPLIQEWLGYPEGVPAK